MSYSLLAVHRTVDEWSNREETIDNSSVANSNFDEQATKALTEVSNFAVSFIEEVSGLNSREAVKLRVESSVVGSTVLANKISRYKAHLHETASGSEIKKEKLENLEEAVLNQLSWLRKSFPFHFNEDQSLPEAMAKIEIARLKEGFVGLKAKLQAEEASPQLIAIIANTVEINRLVYPFTCTYRQLFYFQTLLNSLKEANPATIGSNGLTSLVSLLVEHNFNDPAFIRHTIEQLQQIVADSTSLGDQSAQWSFYVKAVQQVQASGIGLHLQKTSVKEALTSAIREEITYLDQRKQNLASVYGNRTGTSTPLEKGNTVLTALSVSQLAVFCRLFSDCGMIQHSNQTELLKMVAGALQTTRATNISADSLRAKYYSPDRSSIAVVKEHLFRMMNLLKDL